LIKTMKENLARNTSEAVKHYKGSWRIKGQIDSAVNVGEENPEKSASRNSWDLECGKDSFYYRDIYEFYLTTFGSYFENLQGNTKQYGNLTPENGKERNLSKEYHIPVNLHTAVHTLQSLAKENPSFLLDEDICFNLDKEATETLESLIRFGHAETSILEVELDGDADLKSFKKLVKTVTKELILNADSSETEEEHHYAILIPQEDKQSTCTSISDKDWEKLLHITEHFDNNNVVDCVSESLLNTIMVCPKMFADSLSRSKRTLLCHLECYARSHKYYSFSYAFDLGKIIFHLALMSLVEHKKQLQGSGSKIPGALSFAPKDGDQDFSLEELNQDVNDNETSHPIHHQKQNKSSSEDSAKHVPTLRNLCSEAHMFGSQWDDVSWPYQDLFSKTDSKPELSVTANVYSVARNGEMLSQSNCIADIPAGDSQEPEDCFMSNKEIFEKYHMKISQQHFPFEMLDIHDCQSQEIVHVNSRKSNRNFKELAGRHKDCSERQLEIEDAAKNFVDQKTKHSKETTGIRIICGCLEHSEEHPADQHDTFSLDQGIRSTKEMYNDNNEAQITSKDIYGMSELSSSFKTTRMDDKIDEQDHNRQKQRKRYCLDDLIADVVMAECQFNQKALFHFDLAPLCSSLATVLYSFYHQECITHIHFKQLLEACKGMINHGDDMITVQRYYMALLSLAHQQNIGIFK
ncbi:hypothetical protein KI387_020173, partial [Taxus chinensis]